MADTQNEKIVQQKVSEKKDSFASGLFSLMTRQCIFSALLLGTLFLLKNTNLPFSDSVCSAIRSIIGFDMTFDYVKNFITGLFL